MRIRVPVSRDIRSDDSSVRGHRAHQLLISASGPSIIVQTYQRRIGGCGHRGCDPVVKLARVLPGISPAYRSTRMRPTRWYAHHCGG